MAFNIGLSGIRAASTDLEVTGNNVANASTVGFKESRAEFADVYTSTLLGTGLKPVGSGVLVDNVRQEFSQGNISGTENALDLAIDGNGFFVLDDRGSVSYTRSGIFSLDKNGFVVANNGSRLQGYEANENGVVSGVLGDINIQIANQPPRLTTLATAIVNLDAGEQVLQEQGLQITTNGLSVGAADAGILESTKTVLDSAGQPTDAGIPAQVLFPNTVAAVAAAGYGTESMDFDIGDGNGSQTITLAGVAAGATVQEVLNDIQSALDATFGSQQLRAVEDPSTGNLIIERAGFNATNGTSFSITTTPGWDGVFGVAGAVSAGVAGQQLFVGASPVTADFRSIPGTQTTTRTTATPPLNIVASDPGEFAVLTANNTYSALDLEDKVAPAVDNVLAFRVVTEGGASYPINLSEAAWVGAAPTSYAAVSTTEIVAEINAQITATAGAGNEEVLAVNNGGRIEFQVQAPASRGDFVQIADNPTSSVNYDLINLGFLSNNRIDGGVEPVLANNEFNLEVTSSTGNAGGPFTITIPPANYANLEALAVAIQQQIDIYIGAGGLAGKVNVDAVGGQLVFTNTLVGAGEGISLTPTVAESQALGELGFDSMFIVTGQDEVDRTNSFRINLTVPAPDDEGRSGSVVVTLDEEYRSVQQLAASINRQLNSQDADNYIGVQAAAVEVEPKVVPPQYKLQLTAVEAGEASIISITNITAGGQDVSESDLYGILQVNPDDGTLLTTGIEGVTNEYPEQRVTLIDPDGQETEIVIPEHAEANEIVSLFNQQPGVTASAETVMTIPSSGYNTPGNDMSLTLNGQILESTSLEELAEEINAYRATTLPGFRAEVSDAGDLVITNEIGRDIKVSIDSPVVTDSLVVQGASGTGPVVLGGTTAADVAAAVGGTVNFILNENYVLRDPQPVISGIFGALTDDEYSDFTLNSFDPDNQETYNHATSTTIYDSLGNSHVMTQYFVKEPLDPTRPNEQNVWAMYVLIDGNDIGDPDPSLPFPENLDPTRSRFELFFNQDGTLDEVATGDIYITNWDPVDENGDSTGALTSTNVLEGGLPLSDPPTNSNFQISLNGSTQFGSEFSVNEVNQNGYATGRLTGLEVDEEGIIFARFTNGQAQTLGQVAMANFRNPEGLTPVGDTGWAESFESGIPTIGSPRTASFGQIRSSALEDSNVDLSEELVGLIIAQRNFQASAKTIETTDQITQAILNI
ncbi:MULTISPECIES: flagellar hook-basal body complex protein [Thalassolituus]|uniref:flagellar hook-basal body complex protein n=1 Tax=Thalassolituus TaxID=187492 RepID=UPI000C4D75EB|nr:MULTISPECIES: flagellar hook-basal body complex protein [Thalassolituus]MAX87716.1 flagellar biosynthesis protein FlgE [Oceanospirillaceae bacterium]|tara:strand:+ start:30928 stop:34557 length:3630 start_codon:yes stop_codon:yes gene_type:complete